MPHLRTLSIFALASLVVAACGGPAATTPGATPGAAAGGKVAIAGSFNWRMPTGNSATDPYTIRIQEFVDTVKERSDGAINITLFPSGTLMPSPDAPKATVQGTVEMDSVGTAYHSGISSIASVMVPGLAGISADDALTVLKPGSEGRKIFDDHYAQLGLKVLAFWNQTDIGFVSYEPLRTVEDFRGKKIRISNEVGAAVLRALGAEPTVLGSAEAVDAMARRIVDASTCQPSCIFSAGYADFAKYYNEWVGAPWLNMITVNINAWNSLPPEGQKLLQEEADAAAVDLNRVTVEFQGDAMERLEEEKGFTLIEVSGEENTRLLEIARPIYEEFARRAQDQPGATRMFELLTAAARERSQ